VQFRVGCRVPPPCTGMTRSYGVASHIHQAHIGPLPATSSTRDLRLRFMSYNASYVVASNSGRALLHGSRAREGCSRSRTLPSIYSHQFLSKPPSCARYTYINQQVAQPHLVSKMLTRECPRVRVRRWCATCPVKRSTRHEPSPLHSMPFHARNEGFNCVSTTWRAMHACPRHRMPFDSRNEGKKCVCR
jgi:hypothetical protein